ncbi:MAG: hypothetical protein EXS52_00885 [Candidatus Staskawiczbacteria bacterium]|nr:hypothetical protein [Candidatus Staskawiczbacteria bacterium]
MSKLTTEEAFAKAAQMMLIESIIGTHGLSLELSRLARRLLEEGRDPAEVFARVNDVRNDAGEIDQLEQREQEAIAALEAVQHLLDNKRQALSYSEQMLRYLGDDEEIAEEVKFPLQFLVFNEN